MQHRGGFTDGPDPYRQKAPHFAKGDEAETANGWQKGSPKTKSPALPLGTLFAPVNQVGSLASTLGNFTW